MDVAPDTAQLIARIYNAAWWVRHYHRGGISSVGRKERAAAIRELGMQVRFSFNISEDFEALLAAIVNGLSRNDEAPPF